MWSAGISVESYARLASRVYSRGDRFLYGYYNSEQHLIQVKICTAVDKEKSYLRYPFFWHISFIDSAKIERECLSGLSLQFFLYM